MRVLIRSGLIGLTILLSGCVQVYSPAPAYVYDPSDPSQRAVAGGLVGAGAGAAIGGIADGGRGAALGALAGGALGAVAGASTAPPPPPSPSYPYDEPDY